jgi:hypothetical protein
MAVDSGTSALLRARVIGIGAHPHFGEPAEIRAHPGHGSGAERFDPRLFGGIEDGARGLVAGNTARVKRRIMMSKLQRRGVGKTPRFGDLTLGQVPARHWRLDVLALARRSLGSEAQLQLRLTSDCPGRAGQDLPESFDGIVVLGHRLRGQAFPTTLSGRSLPKTR